MDVSVSCNILTAILSVIRVIVRLKVIDKVVANDITNAELGLEGYVMFRKDRIGRRGGGVLLYIKDTIPAYEVQLQEEADCNYGIIPYGAT